MPRVTMDFNLPDSGATEAFGQALARSLPGAARAGVADTGAAAEGAARVGVADAGAGLADAAAAGAGLAGVDDAGAASTDAAAAGAAQADAAAAALRSGTAHSGAVVYLQGELGAGKTTCARSLLRALGVTGLVRSPTYTLVETYRLAALTCVHVDLYRLQSLTEVDELGLRDLTGPGSLLMVEWPEKGGAALPPADLNVALRYAGTARQAGLRAMTMLGTEWVENLGRDTSLSIYVSNLT
jgi:tRNA threonylcarbamoyladenosine biosynthesis protein TsaE